MTSNFILLNTLFTEIQQLVEELHIENLELQIQLCGTPMRKDITSIKLMTE